MTKYLTFDTKIINVTQVASVDLLPTSEHTIATFNFADGSASVELNLPNVTSTKMARILNYVNTDVANVVDWSDAYENS